MAKLNPILELLRVAMEVSNPLPRDPETALNDAIEFVDALVELPDWMPEFIGLVDAMILKPSPPFCCT
jgi:hypothetical protein